MEPKCTNMIECNHYVLHVSIKILVFHKNKPVKGMFQMGNIKFLHVLSYYVAI